ncbi:hypothetical protein [Chitinasiproducens palmae]|uniref:Calcineurin-like phosphoesterase domain-containing protein n=1 Tax=Chitinasiproducens palmae TaxID=1770053 RepID=A0A1H2PSY9_9BURK|nr:hypothetical protein [Chitinasiproducens palmae]SDV49315.1 hypothetical protein SAMN05216551_107234 [Chitinasiproducens palmae]
MTTLCGTADGDAAKSPATPCNAAREGRRPNIGPVGAAVHYPRLTRPRGHAPKRPASAVLFCLLWTVLLAPSSRSLYAAENSARRTAPANAAIAAIATDAGDVSLRGFSFGVIGNLPRSEAEIGAADTVLASLALGDVAFVIDAGNIKGADENCSDRLYERRYDWLQRAPLPVIFLPGENDWVACEYLGTDASDPVQRLDALRARFFPDSRSLGAVKLSLSRQSSYAGFHAYRENTRWRVGGVTFATLSVVGMNNHYVRDGGRNGEFEDRTVANRVWLERTVALARRDRSRALIIVVGVNPWSSAPAGEWQRWWRALTGASIDPYRELRRDLLKAVDAFDGPVYLIHRISTASAVLPPSNRKTTAAGTAVAGLSVAGSHAAASRSPSSGPAIASAPAPAADDVNANTDSGLAIVSITRDGPRATKAGAGTWHGRFGWLRISLSAGRAPTTSAHWYGLDASAVASRSETAASPLPTAADRGAFFPAVNDVLAPDLPPLPPSRPGPR